MARKNEDASRVSGRTNAPGTAAKAKKRQPLWLKLLRAFLVAFVIVALFLLGAKSFGNITASNMVESVKSFFAGLGPGGQYPYAINASEVGQVRLLGSDLAILHERSVLVLNPSAKVLGDLPLDYANPGMEACGGRLVVFDRSSGKFRVQSRSEVLYEKDLGQEILTCAIGKKGNVAVASRAADATSMLTVYKKNLEQELFQWRSSSGHIIRVALSPDGKYAAAAVVNAQEGELYSDVLVFRFTENQPVASFRYAGVTVVDLTFCSGGTLVVTGDKMRNVITDYTKQGEVENFETSTLSRVAHAENGVNALLFSQFGSQLSNRLTVYDKHAKPLYSKEFGETVRSIACDGRHVAVLFEDRVETYNLAGERVGNFTEKNDTVRVFLCGSKLYVFAGGEIRQYGTSEKSK